MTDKDSDNYPRYRITLRIEDILDGATHVPEPFEIYKTDTLDNAVMHFEGTLLELELISDPDDPEGDV